MVKLAYCPRCETFVEFTTNRVQREMGYDEFHLSFSYPEAKCIQCESVASYPPYDEIAQKAFCDALSEEWKRKFEE